MLVYFLKVDFVIFKILSVLGKEIRLAEVQWIHITIHHPEVRNEQRKIIEVLIDPDFILFDRIRSNYNYYKKFQKTPVSKKFMHVIVKHSNKEGFIITSYFTDKIMKLEKVMVYEKFDNKL